MSIANTILCDNYIITKLSPSPRSGRDTNMSHIPHKNNLLPTIPEGLQIGIQICLRKRARKVLRNNLLPSLGCQLLELLRQFSPWSEDRSTLGHFVNNMNDVLLFAGRAVSREQVGDDLAALSDILDFELARGVLVLGVDDDQGGV